MSVADADSVNSRRVQPHRLLGQVALVTGGSGGLGSAVIEALALEGADVVVCHANCDDQAEAEKTAAAVVAAGRRAITIAADVRDERAVTKMISAAGNHFGRLDICVAVAGIGRMAPLLSSSTADFKLVHDVNVLGTYLTVRESARLMAKSGGGKIVTIASIHGLGGTHYNAIYGSSKAAIIALSKGAAFDLADHGIRVNCIAPGAVPVPNDPIPTSRYPSSEEADQPTDMTRAWMRHTPLRRWGDPSEIGRCAVFLCSEDSSFMTGQVLQVDGGVSAGVGIPSFRDYASNHSGLPEELRRRLSSPTGPSSPKKTDAPGYDTPSTNVQT